MELHKVCGSFRHNILGAIMYMAASAIHEGKSVSLIYNEEDSPLSLLKRLYTMLLGLKAKVPLSMEQTKVPDEDSLLFSRFSLYHRASSRLEQDYKRGILSKNTLVFSLVPLPSLSDDVRAVLLGGFFDTVIVSGGKEDGTIKVSSGKTKRFSRQYAHNHSLHISYGRGQGVVVPFEKFYMFPMRGMR